MSLLQRNVALYTYSEPSVIFRSTVSTSSSTSSITLDLAYLNTLNVAASSVVSDIVLLQGNESGIVDFISVVHPLVSASSDMSEFELIEYGLLFDTVIAATTTTSDVDFSVARNLSLAVQTSTSTSPADFDANRTLQVAVSASSSVGDIDFDITCLMAGTISAGSLAADINLLKLIGLAMAAPASSLTSDVPLVVTRSLAMVVSAASSSTDVTWVVLREIISSITATSLASPIGVLVLRPWSATVSAASDTTAPPLLKEISLGNMASTWGEESPTEGERARPWHAWKLSGGGDVEISGDPSWGMMAIGSADTVVGPVLYSGGGTHHFNLYRDIYGSGIGSLDLYIRGDTSSFGQLDGTPTWEEYTGPVNRTWTYVQMRMDG